MYVCVCFTKCNIAWFLPHHYASMQMSHNHNIQLLKYGSESTVLPIHTQKIHCHWLWFIFPAATNIVSDVKCSNCNVFILKIFYFIYMKRDWAEHRCYVMLCYIFPMIQINVILMLAEKFSSSGLFVVHAHADAYLLTVKTALDCAQSSNTVVIGDDTDLLVLLCYHNNVQSPCSVYLKSEPKKRQQQVSNLEHQMHSRKNRNWHM